MLSSAVRPIFLGHCRLGAGRPGRSHSCLPGLQSPQTFALYVKKLSQTHFSVLRVNLKVLHPNHCRTGNSNGDRHGQWTCCHFDFQQPQSLSQEPVHASAFTRVEGTSSSVKVNWLKVAIVALVVLQVHSRWQPTRVGPPPSQVASNGQALTTEERSHLIGFAGSLLTHRHTWHVS